MLRSFGEEEMMCKVMSHIFGNAMGLRRYDRVVVICLGTFDTGRGATGLCCGYEVLLGSLRLRRLKVPPLPRNPGAVYAESAAQPITK